MDNRCLSTNEPKCNCRRDSMQEKESVIVVRCGLKIPSLGLTRDAEQLPW